MSRTIESIVENNRVARERRAKGLPVWDKTIHLKCFLNQEPPEGMTKESAEHVHHICKQIFAVLKARVPAAWREFSDENDHYSMDFEELMENLEQVTVRELATDTVKPVGTLNHYLSDLYDWADRNRVWIG